MRSRLCLFCAYSLAFCAAPASAAPSGADNPVPRVETRLCPGIAGLREDGALQMLDRIRHNAERLGVTLADADSCKPNLLVFFVADPDKTLASLMERKPEMFSAMSVQERAELRQETGPVRAWSQIVTRSRDGLDVDDTDNLVEIPRTSMWGAHSKIYVPVRRDIETTILLFGSAGAEGKSITQLADYVTMRAFAADFSAYPEGLDSIRALFDGGEPAAELTEADMVFLQTLYTGIPNIPGRAKNMALRQKLEGLDR